MSKRRGRPEKDIDENLVRTLASYDCSYEEIAAACKCDPSTLTRRFKSIIDEGRRIGTCSLKRSIFVNATRHNNTLAQIFLMKSRCGYSDKHPAEQQMPEIKLVYYSDIPPKPWVDESR